MDDSPYRESATADSEFGAAHTWVGASPESVEFAAVQGDGLNQPAGTRHAPGGDALFASDNRASSDRGRSSRLSSRERRVLAELARGTSTEDIAERLHVSPHTVRTHVKNIMRKLDARTRAHAVAIAITEDAIDAGNV